MDYAKLREEPLKSEIREDFFKSYKYTQLGNIDFVIAKHDIKEKNALLFEDESSLKSLLWAEAKQGTKHDIYESFVQLILTIGKERTFEKHLPPKYIGAFDAIKFAFIEYNDILPVFFENDFNWNVAPSNHETKEFKELYSLCQNLLQEKSIIFEYEKQAEELKEFIKLNFKADKDVTEMISVTKNNFTFVFLKWCQKVKPTIAVNWEKVNKKGIISADFFLADLLSSNNQSLKENLFVVLEKTHYKYAKEINEDDEFIEKIAQFTDKQKAHKEFWSIYARPPKEEYWDYIINRRDLLVPQDIRERKGSFFTPQIWVEKSQQYLASVLGETWQDEYYIWDCCAGTGNLLNGLTNYDNVWASTLDKQDVDVMKDRINNGWNMAEDHVFQFDFLNDEFSKCPEELQEILGDEEKRKKLVIYINPPYAETDNRKNDRSGVKATATEQKYRAILKNSGNELYAQFLIRIYKELLNCKIGQFSKLKHLQGPNFREFRKHFTPSVQKAFIVPANTFDNVKGEFPIGFFIWDTDKHPRHAELVSASQNKQTLKQVQGDGHSEHRRCEESIDVSALPQHDGVIADVFDAENNFIGIKNIVCYDNLKLMNDWIAKYKIPETDNTIGLLNYTASDMQQQKYTAIISGKRQMGHNSKVLISEKNLIPACIYFAVRLCIEPTWINDRDQFLYPNEGWKTDNTFQSNCLIYTLFHGQNRISCEYGINHWIPFTREQVGCKKSFKSHFMSDFLRDFLAGKTGIRTEDLGNSSDELFSDLSQTPNFSILSPISLSPEAQAGYDAGLELWKYYHSKSNANANASFYDIRKYFQGESNGKMNATSDDAKYSELIGDVREKMKILSKKIEAKVYEYGFLK